MKNHTPQLVRLLAMASLVLYQCSVDPHLDWQQADGYRVAELHVPSRGKVGFALLSPEKTGVSFANALTDEQLAKNHVLSNGSGVAIGDVDGDGLADLYFCRLDGPNVLYKNLGNWRFQDITEQAGVACDGQFSSAALFADIDGDDDLDLLVNSIGGTNHCFLNDGSGVFKDASAESGLISGTGAATMAMADIDGDGDLDLYQANYKALRAANIFAPQELIFENLIEQNEQNQSLAIREKYREHFDLVFVDNFVLWEEKGEPDLLYLNDGDGRFEPVTVAENRFFDEDGKPMQALFDWGLAAKFQDINHDGAPDLYVCNDFNSPDRVWMNDGAGRFRAIEQQAIRHTSHSSMAVDFSDIDRDGDVDFMVLDMLGMTQPRKKMQFNTMPPKADQPGVSNLRSQYMRNTLFLNRGDQGYAEIARMSGVDASDWSWAVSFVDVDLDGYEDAIIATGQLHDTQNLDTRAKLMTRASAGALNAPQAILQYPPLPLENVAFRNTGKLRFDDVSSKWGLAVSPDMSQGMALGDLDNDGDLDVVMNRIGAPAAIYQNTTPNDRIAVRLKGATRNTAGAGAKITVLGGTVQQTKEVAVGGSYLSSSEPSYTFAANGAQDSYSIEVRWRDGSVSKVEGALKNHVYEIDQSAATGSMPAEPQIATNPVFRDVSDALGHGHMESVFDDWQYQSLLPMKLSRLGPGVAMQDFDADGDDDVIIAGGKGQATAIFRNHHGGWQRLNDPMLKGSTQHEQTAVVGWQEADRFVLMVGHSNYKAANQPSFVLRYIFETGSVVASDTVLTSASAIGALAAADYDVDGDLDLFVAGRVMAGQFPKSPSSYLLKNENDQFVPDSLNNSVLAEIGIATGAVFSDIDNKGTPDLLLTSHWGPVIYLRNENGRFRNATEETGLAPFHGLWNGLTTADIDEDGTLDIIASNWGLNTGYQLAEGQSIRLYADDFDLNGTLDIVETAYSPALNKHVPIRSFDQMMRAVPFTRIRIPDYRTYAMSSASRIFGPKLTAAQTCSLTTLEHALFLRKEGRFVRKPLPLQVQIAPGFAVNVADFDGDGHADIFLGQNFFGNFPYLGNDDAGTGQWLRGDGHGGFQVMPGDSLGIRLYGEQRGAAVGDVNGDGRVDFLVSQNGGNSRFFVNRQSRAGIRVRLHGTEKNRSGIGALVRLIAAENDSALFEVKSASGYWSQNSATLVLGKKNFRKAAVFWPGSGWLDYTIPANSTTLTFHSDGHVEAASQTQR